MCAKNAGERIVDIAKRKGLINVVLSSGEELLLSADAFTEFRFYIGKRVEGAEWRKAKSFAKQDSCYRDALSCLSRRPYGENELLDKLKSKGHEEKTCLEVCKRLSAAKLLDDEAYLKEYAEAAKSRLIGENLIRHELREKGFGEEAVSHLGLTDDEEMEKAKAYLRLCSNKLASYPKRKREEKAISALLSRGFDLDLAKEAVANALPSADPIREEERFLREANALWARYKDKEGGKRKLFLCLARKGYDPERIKEYINRGEH